MSTYKPRRISPGIWRERIKKVWKVDPLEYPKCHAEMKIISFITRSQPDVIRQALEHLGFWEKSRPSAVDTEIFHDAFKNLLTTDVPAIKRLFTP